MRRPSAHASRGQLPYHQHGVVAERAALDGGDVVIRVQDSAPVRRPAPLPVQQVEVPLGGHGIGSVRDPPQGDVDGDVVAGHGHAICREGRRKARHDQRNVNLQAGGHRAVSFFAGGSLKPGATISILGSSE